jgi:adenosine kinase
MGAIKIEEHGTQNHCLDPDTFRERYRESFSMSLD